MTAARRTSSKRATVRVLNERTTEWDGAGVLGAFRALDITHMRSRYRSGWQTPARDTQRVLDWLHAHGYRVDAEL